MVAAGLSGPARASVGSVRDHVLGVTLLNGRGEVLTFGGQVAKNVAGYDVSRLMAGSLGILGVICEVSLKVLPISRATATLSFEWDEIAALEQLSLWASQPLPMNASAWHDGRLHVRLAGAAAAVSAACEQAGRHAARPRYGRCAWWSSLRDQTENFFALDAADLSSRRASLALVGACHRGAGQTAGPATHRVARCASVGGAPRAEAREVRAAAALRGRACDADPGPTNPPAVFTPVSEVLMRIHQGLKQAFDPARIFNPGRLYAEL